jgi:2-oxoglutarate dehydrogenase complex dehydrogenase (E1) component-like enzyme
MKDTTLFLSIASIGRKRFGLEGSASVITYSDNWIKKKVGSCCREG